MIAANVTAQEFREATRELCVRIWEHANQLDQNFQDAFPGVRETTQSVTLRQYADTVYRATE